MAGGTELRVATLGAAFSANKGAASMLYAVIQNLPDSLGRCRFDVLTTYPDEDAAEPHLPIIHGRPAAELIAEVAPHLDHAAAVRRLEDLEVADASATAALPGAMELTAALPHKYWAVVTSGSRRLAEARLAVAGIAPTTMVTADDVNRGKPDPQPYVLAAERLAVAPRRCIVVEDSPAGVASGRAAGATVIGVTTRYPPDELAADVHVTDLRALDVQVTPLGVVVTPS